VQIKEFYPIKTVGFKGFLLKISVVSFFIFLSNCLTVLYVNFIKIFGLF